MNWGKLVDYIKENYTHPFAFFGGLFLLWLAFLALDSFLSQIITKINVRLWIYITFNFIWFLIWIYIRNYYPKNKRGYLGIVVAIQTENKKQKIRIKNDFLRQLKVLVKSNDLDKLINIIYLDQAHSKRLINVLDNIKDNTKKWLSISKRIGAHFYIHGDIRERKDKENKYFIDVNSSVVHYPFDTIRKAKMSKGIGEVWIRKYSFEENLEFTGFKLTAELSFIGVRYIIGMAAFLSGDPYLALQLHENLYREFESSSSFKSISSNFQNKLTSIISEECQIISRYEYEILRDYANSKKYLDKSFSYSKVNYGGLLQKAILEYLHENNPMKALVTIERAKSYSKSDGTWKYSKAFLLFTLDEFEKGYKVYLNIANNSFKNEEDRVIQSIKFNQSLLESNPSHFQSNFIIGFLYLEKLDNAPEALSYFEKFIEQSKGISKYNFLNKKSKEIHSKICRIIGID